jgi:acetolactate synthase-1/3 small subunit
METKEHIISILVHNKPGVLSRIAGVFGRLGYNIESLCVAETTDTGVSRIVLASRANSDFTEKIKKQLNKLVDIIEVVELGHTQSVQREMILVGVDLDPERRNDIMRAVDMFNCKIVSMKHDYCILEIIGNKDETETVLDYIKPLGVKEIARTGVIALRRENNPD